MTEESLTGFLRRINSDTQFRALVHRDPAAALAEFDLRPAGDVARAAHDEDALRRLASTVVSGEARVWTWIKKGLSRLFCGPGGTRSWECPKKP